MREINEAKVAIITRPGAVSRQRETASVGQALSSYRKLVHLRAPATLDGGDVLKIGKTLYVGLSSRTNGTALEQMQSAVEQYGYRVVGVPVCHCLHLKSAVTQVAAEMVLINRRWVDSRVFEGMQLIDVDESEPNGANALLIGEGVIYPSGYPKTLRLLESRGISVQAVDISEMSKAEGAVTCCSLVFTNG